VKLDLSSSSANSSSVLTELSDGSISLEKIKKKCMEKNRDLDEEDYDDEDDDYDEVIGNNYKKKKNRYDDGQTDESEEDEEMREERRERKNTKVCVFST
jgi:hypothetical protein